jgi:O-antigen ligase
MPNAGIAYPVSMVSILILYSISGGKLSFNIPMLCIAFTAILSTLINNPPAYFRSWERLGLFFLISGAISPLIQNNKLNKFRLQLFDWLMKITLIITVISFIGYFFNINYVPVLVGLITPSHFGGITIHSMILGPIAVISMCYALSLVLNKGLTKKVRCIFIIISFISFFTALLAASRAALGAGIVAVLFLFFKLTGKRISRLVNFVIVAVFLLVLSFPVWESYTTKIIEKQEYGRNSGTMIATRNYKWNARIREFNSNPLLGVGYASALKDSGDAIDTISGQIEPGSSWLAVLSMLGILGFIPFVYLFGSNLFFLYKDKNAISALLGSILIFFILHMFAEGYVFGGNSFQFFCLWLTLGAVTAYCKNNILFH